MSENGQAQENSPVEESPVASKLNLFQRLKEDGAAPEKAKPALKFEEAETDEGGADAPDEEEAGGSGVAQEDAKEEKKEAPSKSALIAKVLGKGEQKFEASDGEKTIPLDGKLKLKVKPDGEDKEVEFTLKEAVNSYRTRERIAKEFSALDVERQNIQKEREAIAKDKAEVKVVDEHLKAILDAANKGDMMGVWKRMAVMMGDNVDESLKSILGNNKKWMSQYENMSPAEQEALWVKLNAEEKVAKETAKNAEVTREVENARLEAYVAKKQAEFGIKDPEISEAWNALKTRPEVQKLSGMEIADQVVAMCLANRDLARLNNLIKKEAPDYDTTGQEELLKILVDLKAYQMSDAELAELIQGVLDDSASGSSEVSGDVSKGKATGKRRVSTKGATSSQREHQPNPAEKGKKRVPLRFSDIYEE